MREVEWFSADELARLYDWTPGYVRKMASTQKWRRTGRAPTRYFIGDVMRHHERLSASSGRMKARPRGASTPRSR